MNDAQTASASRSDCSRNARASRRAGSDEHAPHGATTSATRAATSRSCRRTRPISAATSSSASSTRRSTRTRRIPLPRSTPRSSGCTRRPNGIGVDERTRQADSDGAARSHSLGALRRRGADGGREQRRRAPERARQTIVAVASKVCRDGRRHANFQGCTLLRFTPRSRIALDPYHPRRSRGPSRKNALCNRPTAGSSISSTRRLRGGAWRWSWSSRPNGGGATAAGIRRRRCPNPRSSCAAPRSKRRSGAPARRVAVAFDAATTNGRRSRCAGTTAGRGSSGSVSRAKTTTTTRSRRRSIAAVRRSRSPKPAMVHWEGIVIARGMISRFDDTGAYAHRRALSQRRQARRQPRGARRISSRASTRSRRRRRSTSRTAAR